MPRWTCHHLHSTATVFCAGEAEDGLMPVSEDPDDVETVVLETERQQISSQIFRIAANTESTTLGSPHLLSLSSSASFCACQWTPPPTSGSGSTS